MPVQAVPKPELSTLAAKVVREQTETLVPQLVERETVRLKDRLFEELIDRISTDDDLLSELDRRLPQRNKYFGSPMISGDVTLRSDLAKSSGSGLSGFVQSGIGAVIETVMDALRRIRFAVQYGTFAQAVTACDGKTLRIDTAISVPADITVPSTITLRFERGGKLVPASGKVVTLNCSIEAGLWQIFDTSAGGSFTGILQVPNVLPEWWGAAGDGVTDDTTPINAAITYVSTTGGTVSLGAKIYKVGSLVLKSGVYLVGKGGMKRTSGVVYGTRLLGTAGSDVITFPDASVNDVGVIGIRISSGRRSIAYLPTGATAITNIHLEDLYLNAPSAECIYISGQSERQFFKYLYIGNGTYGYYHDKGALTHGIFEKSTWEHIYFEGQSKSAIFWDDCDVSGSSHYNFMKVISSGEHAIRIKAGFGGMTFTNLSMESNGTTGKSAHTTGTISSGTPNLVLASATGIAQGDTVTVQGAAASGEDLVTTISVLAGLNATLADNASTSVTNFAVTNATWDDVSLEVPSGSVGQSMGLVLINPIIGSGNQIRYALSNPTAVCGAITIIGGQSGTFTPVYDPRKHVTAINTWCYIREALPNQNFDSFVHLRLPRTSVVNPTNLDNPMTVIPTGPGKTCLVGLKDSNADGSGTWGNFEVRVSDSNSNRVLNISGSAGTLATRGRLMPGNFTSATGGATLKSEGTKGFIYGDAAPTAGSWVLGDIVMNTTPSIGAPEFWKCTVAGTPGTWVPNRSGGTFTCGAAATTTVNDVRVTATSRILLQPTNAAAANLMNGATSLYTSAKTGATSFAVTTANAAAAAGTETFDYVVEN